MGREEAPRVQGAAWKQQPHKMTPLPSPLAHGSVAIYLLFVTGCAAQKVYFDCGAKVDVVDVQGLILSPGFPYNYSSGTHCVWQFFVPIDYQLILEIFDFDVFESHESAAQYASVPLEGEKASKEMALTPDVSAADEHSSSAKDFLPRSKGRLSKFLQSSRSEKETQVVIQEELSKVEITKVSNSARRSTNNTSDLLSTHPTPPLPPSLLLIPGTQPPGDKVTGTGTVTSSVPPRGGLRPNPSPKPGGASSSSPPSPSDTPAASPETQQSVLDACPHDVLYISDLITFSSRFCGSNRPPSSQLVFGSSQEMVEVIMELITTTHWGRGFALLFHYHNRTEPGRDRRAHAPATGRLDSLLAAVSGAAFFAMILTSTLCIIFRPKLCPKRANSCVSNNSEVPEGVQRAAAEVSELQVVAVNELGLEVPTERVDNNLNISRSRSHRVSASGDISQNPELELSSGGLIELDLGTDEVFIASSAPGPVGLSFSPYTQRERFLRHSDTGTGPVGDWPSPDPNSASSLVGARSVKGGGSGGGRPRAWSVRTFQDFLPPQLHRRWCSWNSTSPFTKLVDTTPTGLATECGEGGRKVFSDTHLASKPEVSPVSDSSLSNASYPLTQPAHRQRCLNSTSNLRRSRFTGACFGLLSGTADPTKTPGAAAAATQPQAQSPPEVGPRSPSTGRVQGEGDHINVPVFAISEEEDRQPLVPAEHPGQACAPTALNGLVRGPFESKRPPSRGPQSQANDPQQQQNAKAQWRPWASQDSGGGPHHPSGPIAAEEKTAFVHGAATPSLSQPVVTGKEM